MSISEVVSSGDGSRLLDVANISGVVYGGEGATRVWLRWLGRRRGSEIHEDLKMLTLDRLDDRYGSFAVLETPNHAGPEDLVLSGCQLTDLIGIESLTGLKRLWIVNCPLLDISHLLECSHGITEIKASNSPLVTAKKNELIARSISFAPYDESMRLEVQNTHHVNYYYL